MYSNFHTTYFLFLQITGYKSKPSTITDSQGIFTLDDGVKRGGRKIGQTGKKDKTTSIPHAKRDEKTTKQPRTPKTPKTPKKPQQQIPSENESSEEEYRSR